MGMLALESLLVFVELHDEFSIMILQEYKELFFAITCINIQALTLRLMSTRDLDYLFFGEEHVTRVNCIKIFSQYFFQVMKEFLQIWMTTSRNIMNFTVILQKFEEDKTLSIRLVHHS